VFARDWVLLAYRLPREPSTPRAALWRALRRLGAAQILDGLVALPADSRTREQLEWLADGVIEASGEATVWIGRPGSAAQERALAARMRLAIGAEYLRVAQDARAAIALPAGRRKRALARLRRELRRIGRRDYFAADEHQHAAEAVDALAASVVDRVAA
jgi:hypothetical protein